MLWCITICISGCSCLPLFFLLLLCFQSCLWVAFLRSPNLGDGMLRGIVCAIWVCRGRERIFGCCIRCLMAGRLMYGLCGWIRRGMCWVLMGRICRGII